MEYNLLYKKNLSFAAAPLQKNSKLYGNRLVKTLTQTILYLETHDYQINFVNIDSCHHYGIFGAIVQMSFLSKGPLVARNEERWLVYLQASL